MSKGLILAFVALVLGALAIGFWAKSRFEGQMSEMQTRLYEGIASIVHDSDDEWKLGRDVSSMFEAAYRTSWRDHMELIAQLKRHGFSVDAAKSTPTEYGRAIESGNPYSVVLVRNKISGLLGGLKAGLVFFVIL